LYAGDNDDLIGGSNVVANRNVRVTDNLCTHGNSGIDIVWSDDDGAIFSDVVVHGNLCYDNTNGIRELDNQVVTAASQENVVIANNCLTDNTTDISVNEGTGLITGAPVRFGNIGSNTLTDFSAKTIELGNTTDCTLSRVSAGVLGVEGVKVVTETAANTLTNKVVTLPKISGGLYDTNGAFLLAVTGSTSAVNYLRLTNRASGLDPFFTCEGASSNIGFQINPKGTGAVGIYCSAGNTPTIKAFGADTNVNLNLTTQAAGVVQANGNPVGVKVSVPASAGATGVPGQWAAESGWLYICVATNTWERVATATW